MRLQNFPARSFCKDNARTMQSPKNVKPIEMKALLHEKLRTPRATIFSHSLWRGLNWLRLFTLRSCSVKSNMLITLYLDFNDPVQSEISLIIAQVAMCF